MSLVASRTSASFPFEKTPGLMRNYRGGCIEGGVFGADAGVEQDDSQVLNGQ